MVRFDIGPPVAAEREAWRVLFEGYRRFYKQPEDPAVADAVWAWIGNPASPVECLVAREHGTGRLVGLAHFRDLPRPLSGQVAGFLDDLFVDPSIRGGGVADALIAAVAAEGRKRGWAWLRWFTAEDNYRARAVYDRTARLTSWKTYQVDM